MWTGPITGEMIGPSSAQQQAPPVASQQPSQQPSLFGISLTSLLVLSSSRGARRAP
jgi:hypothetical protein